MIAAVDHCLRLLDLLAARTGGSALGEIAATLGLPKSEVHRLLSALLAGGYVIQEPASQDYALSLKLAAMGFRFLDANHLPDCAQLVLDRLAARTEEYCRLAMVEGERLVWIACAQGARTGLRYEPPMNQEVIIHATATGKAWLATMPEATALKIVNAHGLKARASAGARVARDLSGVRRHWAETRSRGYALAVDEGEHGTVAVAVPFHAWAGEDAPVAGTISVAGPALRMPESRQRQVAAALKSAATEMSRLWPLRKRQSLPPPVPPLPEAAPAPPARRRGRLREAA